jgi:curved DNA-binding protein
MTPVTKESRFVEFRDYYKILGVAKTASADEIKKAYRKQARKYHPDVSKEADAEMRMKEVNEANAVLSDPEKRAAYDQAGSAYRPGQEFQPPPDWGSGFEFSGNGAYGGDSAEFSDFFSSLFGQTGSRRGAGAHQARGEDHHAKVMIELADAYHGATQTITLRAARFDAAGHVVTEDRTLKVQIPKGIKEGQHIRLAGQGSPGLGGGAAGDLYLEVHFKPDARYRVEGRDVHQSLPVTPWEAALGAEIEVPTLAGALRVSVPPGSQSGRKLRLKARGIPGNPPGDLYLMLEVMLPPADTDKARELYETMAREMPFNPRQPMGA